MQISAEIQNEMEHFSTQNTWRENLLQKILVFSAITGLFALIPAALTTSDLVRLSVYIGVFVLVVSAIVLRLPYTVKAAAFVLLFLILGVSSLTQTGVRGEALYYFLAFVIFTSLLIGSRAGIASLVVAELVISGMGYLILNGDVSLANKEVLVGDLTDWLSTAASQLFISLITVYALQKFNQIIDETQQHTISLQEYQKISQSEIENRVTERTLELSRKTNLLNAVSTIVHQALFLPDLDKLLKHTVNLISKYFECRHVGIYLINQRGDYVTLQAASSEVGKRLREQGFRVGVGTNNIIGYVAAERRPRILLDVGKDITYLENSEFTDTRSEMSIPLLVHNKLIGVLDIHSSDDKAFKYEDMDIFQSMADQVAAAIENARLITKSKFVISQLEVISSENTRRNWHTESSNSNPIFRYTATGVGPVGKAISHEQVGENVLFVPIVLRGQKIGKISLKRSGGLQKWTAQEKTIASDVIAQTALALENIRLVERTRGQAEREQTISNMSARIRESLDLDIILRTSARELQKAFGLQEAEISLLPQNDLDDEDDRIEVTF